LTFLHVFVTHGIINSLLLSVIFYHYSLCWVSI